MNEIVETVELLWNVFITGGADLSSALTGVKDKGKTPEEVYRKGFKKMLFFALIMPLIIFVAALEGLDQLAAVLGFLWAAVTIIFSIVAAPAAALATLIAALWKKPNGVAKKYADYVLNGVFIELIATFLAIIIPVKNNIADFPLYLLIGVILMFVGGFKTIRKIAVIAAWIVFVGLTLSFFFPNVSTALKQYRGVGVKSYIDRSIAAKVSGTEVNENQANGRKVELSGEEPVKIVWTGPGTSHEVCSGVPWMAVILPKDKQVPAGCVPVTGGKIQGWLKGRPLDGKSVTLTVINKNT